MNWWKEAWHRFWTKDLPPFWIKLQRGAVALGVAGGSLMAVNVPERFAYVHRIAENMTVAGAVIAIAAQFAIQGQIILSPGDSLTNKTEDPVAVNVDAVKP